MYRIRAVPPNILAEKAKQARTLRDLLFSEASALGKASKLRSRPRALSCGREPILWCIEPTESCAKAWGFCAGKWGMPNRWHPPYLPESPVPEGDASSLLRLHLQKQGPPQGSGCGKLKPIIVTDGQEMVLPLVQDDRLSFRRAIVGLIGVVTHGHRATTGLPVSSDAY